MIATMIVTMIATKKLIINSLTCFSLSNIYKFSDAETC